MNLGNPINERLPILPQEARRVFGKDITNIAKNTQGDFLSKKMTSFQLPPITTSIPRDAICDYQEQILQFMTCYPQNRAQQKAQEVSQRMRHILVDWLVDVQQSFQLNDQTLFLALLYLNEYEGIARIRKEDYQLVGITCLWMASKYEQIYPPRMKDFVEVTANTYTRSQLTNMEGTIISALGFNLTRVTHLALLTALQQHSGNTNSRAFSLARYVIQMSFLSGNIPRKYERKTVMAAAVKLGESVCKEEAKMNHLGCELGSEFYECYKELCVLLQGQNKYKLNAIKRKYQHQKYHGVGKISVKVQS